MNNNNNNNAFILLDDFLLLTNSVYELHFREKRIQLSCTRFYYEQQQHNNNNNNKLGPIGHTVASGQPPSEGWRPGGETCVFARTSCLFGVCGKHTLPPG